MHARSVKDTAIYILDWLHSQCTPRFYSYSMIIQWTERQLAFLWKIAVTLPTSCERFWLQESVNSATVQLSSKRRTISSSRIRMRGNNWIWEKATQHFAITLCQCIEAIPIRRRRGVDVHHTSFPHLSPLSAGVVSMIELLTIDN